MSVIIRLQNLPWSANAMDIRTFFRGLSIPEGGVHIVGGEQGDAFIAFSTDEDARQAMMNDGGKIKEVQVKLLLSSRSEMHKVIEAARQSVPIMQLSQPVIPVQQPTLPPAITGLLAQNMKMTGLVSNFPITQIEPIIKTGENVPIDLDKDKRIRDPKNDRKVTRSRSKSRDKDKRDRGRDKKDKRDRSRSRDRSRDRDRRRRDRSRSRDRRNRNRDRKDRSRDRERSKESNDPRLLRKDDKKPEFPFDNMMPLNTMNHSNLLNKNFPIMKAKEGLLGDYPMNNGSHSDRAMNPILPMSSIQGVKAPFSNHRMNPTVWAVDSPMMNSQVMLPMAGVPPNIRANMPNHPRPSRFNDNNNDREQMNRLQELDERRNPNAFQSPDNPGLFGNRNSGPRVPYHENNFGSDNTRMPGNNSMNNQGYANYETQNRYGQNTPRGYCIKIQNLLSTAGYGDIRRFFAGNYISNQGLKIINNDNGKRSGTAYVKFFKYDGKKNALDKNGELLKGRPVAITSVDEDEFENAVDSFRPNKESEESGDESDTHKGLLDSDNHNDNSQGFKILVLEDLPAFAKEHDIMKMFSDYSLLSIVIIVTKDIRKQYVAYVQFVNADDAKAALNNKAKHLIGHKIIKVSPCSEAAFETVKANQNMLSDDHSEVKDEEEDFNIREDVPISRDPRQRRFDNRVDEMEGFNKHGKSYNSPNQNMMNPRFPWRPNHPNAMNHNNREHRGMRRPQMSHDYNKHNINSPRLDCTFLKGLPLSTTDRDILDFFSDVGVIPIKTHLMLTIQGEPSGDCFCEFIDPEEAVNAASKHGASLNGNPISVELVTKQVVDEARGLIPSEKNFHHRGGFRGARGFFPRGGRRMRGGAAPYLGGGTRGNGNRFMAPNEIPDGAGIEGFGSPGCVLSLENVPFRAEIDEILEFFGDFNLSQNDVIRRFNENGHPTGDVRVCLRSPIDAQRAMQQLNLQRIRDRTITISIL